MTVRALHDRNAVDPAGCQRRTVRFRENSPVLSRLVERTPGSINDSLVREYLGERLRPQAGSGLVDASDPGPEGDTTSLRCRKCRSVEQAVSPAFDDGLMEQSGRGRRHDVRRDVEATRGLAKDRDIPRITTKLVDIPLDPSQC